MEHDMSRLENLPRRHELVVDGTYRRAAIARDIARRIEPRLPVALGLHQHHTQDGLRPGEEQARDRKVIKIGEAVGRFRHGAFLSLLRPGTKLRDLDSLHRAAMQNGRGCAISPPGASPSIAISITAANRERRPHARSQRHIARPADETGGNARLPRHHRCPHGRGFRHRSTAAPGRHPAQSSGCGGMGAILRRPVGCHRLPAWRKAEPRHRRLAASVGV